MVSIEYLVYQVFGGRRGGTDRQTYIALALLYQLSVQYTVYCVLCSLYKAEIIFGRKQGQKQKLEWVALCLPCEIMTSQKI